MLGAALVVQAKAFIVVFVFALAALLFFQRPFSEAIGADRTKRWRNLWLAATLCAFAIFSYWPFIVLTGLLVIIMSRREPLKPAIFLLLFTFVPAMGDAIPGFAGINKFIVVTPVTMLTIVILLPAMLDNKRMKPLARGVGAADLCFLLYLLLQIGLSMRAESFTHMLRTGVDEFLGIAPVYYVFSRYPRSLQDMRALTAAFIFPVLALASVSMPEIARGWHFYSGSVELWLGDTAFNYTMREGLLRAAASVYNPIVWGLVVMTTIGLGLAFINEKFSRFYKIAGFGLLTAGLIASLSRGPWVGAAAMVVTFVMISPRAASRVVQLGAATFFIGLASLATPLGKTIIGLIPFIGDSATGTISYRRQLLEAARQVMMENPLFGSGTYLDHPKLVAMRQGQGIIDIVNTYLQVGLKSGFIGLGLFIGAILFALFGLWNAMRSARKYDPALALYCRAYFATLAGVAITIFTMSNILQTPALFWAVVGMSVALARIERDRRATRPGAANPGPAMETVSPQAKQFDWK